MLLAFLPEILIFASGLLILFLFTLKRSSFDIIASTSFVVLLIILLISVSGVIPSDTSIGGLFSVNRFTEFFRIIIFVSVLFTFLFSSRSREISESTAPEYYMMLFLFASSASFMVMAENLLALYISMEILSLISYILVSFDFERARSKEAGLKYAIYGAAASALMLFGISYLYGTTGSLYYSEIAEKLSEISRGSEPGYLMHLLITLMIFGGLFFKLAAFPFYAWSPDVYQGGPTPFVALLSVASKAAALGALVKIIMILFAGKVSDTSGGNISIILSIVSVFTMTIGNLLAINQNNLKRLLAYSSIAQAGYMIMALSAVDEASVSAVKFYIVAYLVMNLGAFYSVQVIADRVNSENIEEFYGLSTRNPFLAAVFTIFLLSLTGIPPFFGFIGKFYLFAAIISKGGGWYYTLAVIGVINSAISLYYYARIIRAMYLVEGSEEPFIFDSVRKYTLAFLCILTIVFGVYFAPVLRMVEYFSMNFR
ncbi:MAG: NADH-quinone oxidoreductase subunit N [Deltaproteobacteria bacterium]|nr:NADH-quinone oxidoreductase subunit N [Deltaproteobacteria bacterium]